MRTLPATIVTTRTETSVDNAPNRFVRFALEQWRAIVADIGAALGSAESTTASIERGIREVAALLARLDALLAADLFREVQPLTYFPAGNQVLLKRGGYRHLLSAYAQFQLSARLAWPGMKDVYSAGQRNVATLYEYWVYLHLGKTIARLCNRSFDLGSMIEPSKDGLTLRLHVGERRVLLGTVNRLGRTIRLELWFNRTFFADGKESGGEGSWTRPMRPDCSLRAGVTPAAGQLEPVWVHFDAKYRVDTSEDAVGLEPEDEPGESSAARTDWLPATMVKMHAYKRRYSPDGRRLRGLSRRRRRATIPRAPRAAPWPGSLRAPAHRDRRRGRRTGHRQAPRRSPEPHRAAIDAARARPLLGRASLFREAPSSLVPAVPFLVRPPADMVALLGYTKSAEHRAWIARALLYNLRADSHRSGAVAVDARELGADHLIVYGEAPDEQVDLYRISGNVQLLTAEQLAQLGYPTPRGERYFCLLLEPIPSADKPSWLDGTLVRRSAPARGARGRRQGARGGELARSLHLEMRALESGSAVTREQESASRRPRKRLRWCEITGVGAA